MIESQRYNLKFQEKIMIHEREKVQNSMENSYARAISSTRSYFKED